ncbi:uncharacterized protein V2V93DRAFT_369402 [Kockiozyma suomiensis]|uniref:uncharacterized protein n=1 Tax=Kockiozyma suomiensis TaxID=1337062 RepID=UPI0033436D96
MNWSGEIEALKSEYISILDFPLVSDCSIDICTKESTTLRLSVSAAGWTIENIERRDGNLSEELERLIGRRYEDAETALKLVSPAFVRDWQDILIQKLVSVQSES